MRKTRTLAELKIACNINIHRQCNALKGFTGEEVEIYDIYINSTKQWNGEAFPITNATN